MYKEWIIYPLILWPLIINLTREETLNDRRQDGETHEPDQENAAQPSRVDSDG